MKTMRTVIERIRKNARIERDPSEEFMFRTTLSEPLVHHDPATHRRMETQAEYAEGHFFGTFNKGTHMTRLRSFINRARGRFPPGLSLQIERVGRDFHGELIGPKAMQGHIDRFLDRLERKE